MLATDRLGGGRRIALLHGFTQTRRCWNGLDELLAERHEVVRVDLPGHGDADPLARPLGDTVDALADEVGSAVWVGYSMGGRHLLQLAADRPEVIDGAVLIGATAGIDDADARAERHRLDCERASRIIAEGVEAFLDAWLAMPMFATVPPSAAHLEERRHNTVEGLATSLVLAGTGNQEPLWDRLRSTAPAVFVVGELDARFHELAERLDAAWPGPSRVESISGCGHAAHLEAPEAVADVVHALVAEIG
ncbi:MAG: alpha/beta fold hydrolase [Actinomycetota bacterium]